MKKTLTYTILLTCVAFYFAWLSSGCKKDHGDGSGDSCFTSVFAPVDSVSGADTVHVFDTLKLTVWTTAPSGCYDNLVIKDAGGSGTNLILKGYIDLNHCLTCPAATTPKKAIYNFVPNQPGAWTLVFYNNAGNLTYNVNVN